MKRKFGLILIIFTMILCSGCQGDVTRAIRHDGFTIGSDFVCDALLPKNKKDTDYEKVRYITGTHIITENGKLYEISLSQQYSNEANCRVANTNIEVVSIFDNKVVKSTDGKFYYLTSEGQTGAYTEVTKEDNNYSIYNLLLGPEGTIKVVTADSNKGIYYVLKNDGNVYSYTLSKADNRDSAPNISGTSVVYNKNDYAGEIIDFNYAGNSSTTFARTKNKTYKMYPDNETECSKFVDVECKYKMKEFEAYSEYSDYFIAYNGSIIITSYGKVFNSGR